MGIVLTLVSDNPKREADDVECRGEAAQIVLAGLQNVIGKTTAENLELKKRFTIGGRRSGSGGAARSGSGSGGP